LRHSLQMLAKCRRAMPRVPVKVVIRPKLDPAMWAMIVGLDRAWSPRKSFTFVAANVGTGFAKRSSLNAGGRAWT